MMDKKKEKFKGRIRRASQKDSGKSVFDFIDNNFGKRNDMATSNGSYFKHNPIVSPKKE